MRLKVFACTNQDGIVSPKRVRGRKKKTMGNLSHAVLNSIFEKIAKIKKLWLLSL